MRRIGVLIQFYENVPEGKTPVSEALADLGWIDGRNVRMDFRWAAVTSTGCKCSRKSWSACNPT